MISLTHPIEKQTIVMVIQIKTSIVVSHFSSEKTRANQRHPKVTSGRMMDTELTLINPFVKFIRNVRNCEIFAGFPMELLNGCCVGDWLQFNAFCLHNF